MTIAIVVVMLLGYILMASEHFTHINKSMIALFCGTVGWVLFMCTGTDFIDVLHAQEFRDFLGGEPYSLHASKVFISQHIFLKYVAQVGSLALYLLATMGIVEVLQNNECFSFLNLWLRRRSTTQMVWLTATITFVLSSCIDNLTITVMMLMILRKIIHNHKQRMYLGAVVVIAANCGGCWTVIGDVSSLIIWTKGAITPTNFSFSLILPALVATIVPSTLICMKLPEHIDIERPSYIYRGDDSVLDLWQKIIMLFFGIGGLWFIPSFSRITLLPPFLGALCVLGFVWVLNELINIKRINTEQPQNVSMGRSLQYEVLQVIMYTVGLCLCVDVLVEIGVMNGMAGWCEQHINSVYIGSVIAGFISSILDNLALALFSVNIFDVVPDGAAVNDFDVNFLTDGRYWHLIILCASIGGCLLPIGNPAGLALMKSEDVTVWWYFRRISFFVVLSLVSAIGTYYLVDYFLRDVLQIFDY